jgi:heat shock protein HspQ
MSIDANFSIGQTVRHLLFNSRGVVFDVDPVFLGDDEWYRQVARTRPPKDHPWYRVLVHGSDRQTYVAQRNLEPDPSGDPVVHPLTAHFFVDFRDGLYVPRQRAN